MDSADQHLVNKLFVVPLDPDGPEPSRTPETSDTEDEVGITPDDSVPGGMPMSGFQHSGRQTGPKGVLDDYKHAMHVQTEEMREGIKKYNLDMEKKAPTTTTYKEDMERQRQQKHNLKDGNIHKQKIAESDEEDEEDLKEDDEIVTRYRAQRLNEMKMFAQPSSIISSSKRPIYGRVMEVNAEQYVAITETAETNQPLGTMVIVHIYDSEHQECILLNKMFINLATKYAHAKFLRLQSSLAFPDKNHDEYESEDGGFDYLALPTILAYRAPEGRLIANLIRVTDDVLAEETRLGRTRRRGQAAFSMEAVEQVLLKNGALRAEDAISDGSSKKYVYNGEEYDSDE